MLTDREIVALQLFQNVVSNWPDVFFITRTEDVKTIKELADSALVYADIFLEETRGTGKIDPIDLEVFQEQNNLIGEKIERIIEINQHLITNNRALIELINNTRQEDL
jgi:hypothetical protein